MASCIRNIIRPAVQSDLGQIDALERLCSQNPWTRGGIASELSNPNSIFPVLELTDILAAARPPNLSADGGNQIIGFACSSLILDELHINETAVHPDHRNRGYGSMLINHLLKSAYDRKAVRALLEVRISNHSAIKLYEKCGFVRDGIRKGYYQNGEDALLMSREIRDR